MALESVNPATGEVIEKYSEHSREQINEILGLEDEGRGRGGL